MGLAPGLPQISLIASARDCMPREISAGAIVYRKTKTGRQYLVLKYGWGHWDFPKGHMEEGESEHEPLRRELKEETGISRIWILPGYRETIKYYYHSKKHGRVFKIVIFYLVETKSLK